MILKNNEQRKDFLKKYKSWDMFHEVPELGVKYYRYKLPTNAVIIATEWLVPKTKYFDEHVDHKFCLLVDKNHTGTLPVCCYDESFYLSYRLEGISASYFIDYLRINKCDRQHN